MAELVKFDLKDGGFIVAEIERAEPVGNRPIGRPGIAEKAAMQFEEALNRLGPLLKGLIGQLRNQVDTPDQISVEFGFKLSGDLGIIIAKTQAEGNFKLSVTWKGASKN